MDEEVVDIGENDTNESGEEDEGQLIELQELLDTVLLCRDLDFYYLHQFTSYIIAN